MIFCSRQPFNSCLWNSRQPAWTCGANWCWWVRWSSMLVSSGILFFCAVAKDAENMEIMTSLGFCCLEVWNWSPHETKAEMCFLKMSFPGSRWWCWCQETCVLWLCCVCEQTVEVVHCLDEIAWNTFKQRWQNLQLIYQLLGSHEWNAPHRGFMGFPATSCNLLLHFTDGRFKLAGIAPGKSTNKASWFRKNDGKICLDIPAMKYQNFREGWRTLEAYWKFEALFCGWGSKIFVRVVIGYMTFCLLASGKMFYFWGVLKIIQNQELKPLHPCRLTWNIIMEVWFRSCSFPNGWFVGSSR